MTDRFTPGPWTIKKSKKNPLYCYIHSDKKLGQIADVYDLANGATAKLIAAAPEMYEALKAITYGIDKYDGAFDWINSNETIKAFEQARAVLEKVKK